VKRDKEAAELKAMTQSIQMNSMIDNSKWEMESALARKNSELEEIQHRCDMFQANVQKLETELVELRATSQLELDNSKCSFDELIASKDTRLTDMQMKLDNLQDLLEKQVLINTKLSVKNYLNTMKIDSAISEPIISMSANCILFSVFCTQTF